MELKGINSIGDDSYFIRLSDKNDVYLHPDKSLETAEEVGYKLIEGTKGAGIWKKQQALNLIMESGASNLEIVKTRDVLGNDSSLN
jgi:hypothetical protein